MLYIKENHMNEEFWRILEELISRHDIVIDRPKGSRHPRYPEMVYELDYGYLAGTSSMDGGGMDLWRGSRADGRLVGIVCTVDRLKSDSEIKLLIGCTGEEMRRVHAFHNGSEYMKGLLIERDE